MKIIATLSLGAVAGLTALSQNPTMTISHSGIYFIESKRATVKFVKQ